MRDLASDYLEKYAGPKKRPKSVRDDRGMLDNIVLPKLGSQKVAAVGRREIEGLHAAIERAGRNTPAMEATGAGRRDPRSGFHGCENCLMADDG